MTNLRNKSEAEAIAVTVETSKEYRQIILYIIRRTIDQKYHFLSSEFLNTFI